MIYLAESGSTKCDAVFINKNGEEIRRFRHIGFNPYFHNSDFVATEIQKIPEVRELGEKIEQVYFYGAGCSSPKLNQIIADGLKAGFPNAEIKVDHDLRAAAYATYQGEPEITCILGTGSNCLYYDGQSLIPGNSGYGFIIGDEGSASYIGKQLVRSYLYKQMPAPYRDEFHQQYGFSVEDIRENIYNKPGPNVFLGSLAPFAHERLHIPFFYQLVFNGFKEFIETQILTFEQSKEVKINFVGSVAHHFRAVLEDVLNFFDLELGVIIRRPVDGLVNYHLSHVLKMQKT